MSTPMLQYLAIVFCLILSIILVKRIRKQDKKVQEGLKQDKNELDFVKKTLASCKTFDHLLNFYCWWTKVKYNYKLWQVVEIDSLYMRHSTTLYVLFHDYIEDQKMVEGIDYSKKVEV